MTSTMTIHVNIGEAKTRLSELVAAAVRGEEVVLGKAGVPQVRLVPTKDMTEADLARRAAKRRDALGMFKDRAGGASIDVVPSMTDAELDERWERKFGTPA